MTAEDFRHMVQGAAEQAGRKFQIIHESGAGADHPIALGFPEGRYLKFLALQAG
jgi:23S rRNA (cytosine1962-C5)-methyltransferase